MKGEIFIANKKYVFKLRLTEDDYKKLSKQAEMSKLSKSAVMYSAWKKLKITQVPPLDYTAFLTELRRIGNNLNQLMRIANSGFTKETELKKVIAELCELDRKMSQKLGGE